MNKKKLLALLMALVMTLTLVPVTAFATGETYGATLTENGAVADFVDFYDAIAASEGDTISYDGNGINVKLTEANFTHSGNGKQYYVFGGTAGSGATRGEKPIVISNVIFSNNNNTDQAELYFSTSADVTFENCVFNGVNINMTAMTNGSKATVNHCTFENIAKNYAVGNINAKDITITNCLFTGGKKVIHMMPHGTEDVGTVNISNNKFINIDGEKGVISFRSDNSGTTLYPKANITIDNNEYVNINNTPLLQVQFAEGKFTPIHFVGNTIDGYSIEDTNKMEKMSPTELYIVDDCIVDELPAVSTNVAEIVGGEQFPTLAEAFATATDGDTVKLLGDVTPAEATLLQKAGTYTLDLGGHTLYGRINLKQGDLTIQNGTISHAQPLNVYGAETQVNGDYVTLTIDEGVTIKDATWGIIVWPSRYDSIVKNNVSYGVRVNMNGRIENTADGIFVHGYIGNSEAAGPEMDAAKAPVVSVGGTIVANDFGIQMSGAAVVNVTGSVTAPTAIGVKRGTLNVSDYATISATGVLKDPADANFSGTEPSGAAISVTPTYNNYGTIAVNVTGGTITSANGAALYVGHSKSGVKTMGYTNGATVSVTGGTFQGNATTGAVKVDAKVDADKVDMPAGFITGGTFNSEPAAGYIATGHEAVALSGAQAGWYQVVPEGSVVAKIGDAKYATLAAAVAAVPTNGTQTTIKLLKDAVGSGMVVAGTKNIVFDFDGHKYTLVPPGAGSTNTETIGFQLLKGAVVKFYNGTITIDESNKTLYTGTDGKNIYRIIQSYANVTIENMTIDGTNQYAGVQYVMSFNHDNVNIIGNTTIIGESGKAVFDSDNGSWGGYDKTDPLTHVTINTTGTITGNIEVSKGGLEIENVNLDGAVTLGNPETPAKNISITGGKFSAKPAAAYIADGYAAKNINDDPYYYEVSEMTVEDNKTPVTVDQKSTLVTDSEYEAAEAYADEINSVSSPVTPVTVSGVVLTADETVGTGNNRITGIQAVVNEARDKNSDFATALSTAAKVEIEVDVRVTPKEYNETIKTFELTPYATAKTYAPGNDETASAEVENIAVTNAMIDQDQPIYVKLYVGGTTGPIMLLHVGKNSTDALLPGEEASLTNFKFANGYCEFYVSHFSDIKALYNPSQIGSLSFNGGSLRRHVKMGSDGYPTGNVVNTSTDLRMEYTWNLPENIVIDTNASYIEWSVNGQDWHRVYIKKYTSEGANLVLTGVKNTQFGLPISTRIHVAYRIEGGTDVYELDREVETDVRSVADVCGRLQDVNNTGIKDTWRAYAKFLMNGGTYIVTLNSDHKPTEVYEYYEHTNM